MTNAVQVTAVLAAAVAAVFITLAVTSTVENLAYLRSGFCEQEVLVPAISSISKAQTYYSRPPNCGASVMPMQIGPR